MSDNPEDLDDQSKVEPEYWIEIYFDDPTRSMTRIGPLERLQGGELVDVSRRKYLLFRTTDTAYHFKHDNIHAFQVNVKDHDEI